MKKATAKATAHYFEERKIHPAKIASFDELWISRLGVGTHMGAADDATDELYEKNLVRAALGGVNCLDTAIHYREMRSEKVFKRVLARLEKEGIGREELMISTKGGLLPVEGEEVRIQFLDTGIIEAEELVGDCHCMSPRFLDHQIETSLENMGLASIDLYYLHSPDLQLSEIGEDLFYARLEKAFELFEKKVQEGKIARYGIASWNGFRVKKNALQLSKIVECAKRVGGEEHHFKAILIPYNLIMLEGIKLKNQGEGKEKRTICKAALDCNIAIMSASPFMQGQVTLLSPHVFEKLPPDETPMLQSLQYVLSTPGICTTYAGMREEMHWEENQKALLSSPWSLEEWETATHSLGL